ncbi:hypothetical protein Rleg4DRAFT_1543 [Rhizobium leguminosarum bv. trifolii WSM2297]|uniref:Uncharacterized protein n=1 Tax=Rhizobium leguminosarum bv. trifolii WSM2297 TaxID=754762 RepID=J0CA31_RHILT|nr:hypothetical protein Rleg4DRAFT_1543 [Rhizobium leguminosarum bv. trifolii WSM2297]
MSLLKFFLNPALAMGGTEIAPAWKDDPLRHPEVERMSLREIADLPLVWRPALLPRPSRRRRNAREHGSRAFGELL